MKKKDYWNMRKTEISKEPVELYKILKFENMAASGGEAKHLISEGQVMVNGEVETRKRKKIFSGDIIEFGDEKLMVQVGSDAVKSESRTLCQAKKP